MKDMDSFVRSDRTKNLKMLLRSSMNFWMLRTLISLASWVIKFQIKFSGKCHYVITNKEHTIILLPGSGKNKSARIFIHCAMPPIFHYFVTRWYTLIFTLKGIYLISFGQYFSIGLEDENHDTNFRMFAWDIANKF